MDSNIFLSIVTVHFQDFSRLKTTLDSIKSGLSQSEVQWIVVDGGSVTENPDEIDVVEKVQKHADVFVSESDDGIYDAMNKGMRLSHGEYVLFLNSGDKLVPEFLPASLSSSLEGSRPDMIWGKVRFEYPDGTFGVRKLRGTKWLVYGMPVCHQSVLFLRQTFGKMQYNLRHRIAADYELIARAVHMGAQVKLINTIISEYSKGGASQRDQELSLSEEGLIRVESLGVPVFISNVITRLKGLLWKLSDFSPGFNRIWRKRI